jgi:hypothetical protein
MFSGIVCRSEIPLCNSVLRIVPIHSLETLISITMSSVPTLNALLIDELKDLYHAENQLLKALPKMAKAATNRDLKASFTGHLAHSRKHVARLARALKILKGAARHDPDASCEAYFSRDEWQPAYLVHTDGGELPSEPLTISAFMLMIAELGGWQRKRNQGPPGSMTIWRGLRRMEAYADAFQAFQKAKSRCGG